MGAYRWILVPLGLVLGGCTCCDRAPASLPCPPVAPVVEAEPAPALPQTDPDIQVVEEPPATSLTPPPPEDAPAEIPKPAPPSGERTEAQRKAADHAEQMLKAADADIDELKRLSRKRNALNDGLIQYLDGVALNYARLQPPQGIQAADSVRFVKGRERMRRHAEKLFLRCLTLVTIEDGRNIRKEVNLAAAQKLGQIAPHLDGRGRKRVSRDMQRAIEKRMMKVETHDVSPYLLEESFTALALLNSLDSIEWMLDEYVHTKEREVMYLVAAHKALPRFENVPGKLRYEIVEEFIKTYAHLETALALSKGPRRAALLRVWNEIGPGVIAVVLHFARGPRAADGTPLKTMQMLRAWFRQHKNPRKAPWTDARETR